MPKEENGKMGKEGGLEENNIDEEELSPIEQVRLTVSNTDDPSLPVWTFRMWFLGLISCAFLSFLNQFFSYRTEPLIITQLTVQVGTLPIGHLMASILPRSKFRLPGFGSREFSFNPGPFNMKEHVLITIFASAGCAFGNGTAYAVGIVNIVKAFYHRKISFIAAWLLVVTTQVLGYGWAGLVRKYVIDPGHMWWPGTLVQVSLFRALHEKEKVRNTRARFFLIAFMCSFIWYVVPGFLFPTLTSISWVCWVFKKSVTAQQLGSGMSGLGLGAFTLDWAGVASFFYSPLVSPFFTIVNIFFGYALFVYIAVPIAYWGFDLFNAQRFPIFSSHLFTSNGERYNISAIVNDKFEIDIPAYEKQGRINLPMWFALSYGFGFATIASTLTHVALFNGREIYQRYRASNAGKMDIHTRLMRKYEDIPQWWFYVLLIVTMVVSLVLCTVLVDQVQMPWWGLLFASGFAIIFTLPISIITATTNQSPGLNVITEYVMGVILPGRPIANVCFKTYAYLSMGQAISFLSDFKLGHYMKVPPRSMFLVQFISTIVAGTVNLRVAWWLLDSVHNMCNDDLLPPNSPWTCPNDRVFFDASVIWGLVGPKRIFGSLGNYGELNWFFLGGFIGPVLVWFLHKAFPKQSWIRLINLPVLLGATAMMPPATALNYNCWIIVGTFFNFFIFRYRKRWWQRYNYVLSAALDCGLACMAVVLYFTLNMENRTITWWGSEGDHCDLATCPTAKGVVVDGCPAF
ncbi:oligopeptide transporter 4-like isoform X2 [Telopea speciosissima]|uniref:oligopeptide transporter 4-like isoform X2 n=1 Tax=Telopea speciosissima TaxID=54955 RepID=UPI001CC41753|nr:oligopeptide transporter 4-like isoform X2 [Telopea speciosissima]